MHRIIIVPWPFLISIQCSIWVHKLIFNWGPSIFTLFERHGFTWSELCWIQIWKSSFWKLPGLGMSNMHFLIADVIYFLSDKKMTLSEGDATKIKSRQFWVWIPDYDKQCKCKVAASVNMALQRVHCWVKQHIHTAEQAPIQHVVTTCLIVWCHSSQSQIPEPLEGIKWWKILLGQGLPYQLDFTGFNIICCCFSLQNILDVATDRWGIKVERVEV